ncbi:MAG: glutaminyl-peptide cyclotransferase [Bacteroidota bacterium]
MHFGQYKLKLIVVIALLLVLSGCKNTDSFMLSFKSPEPGQTVKIGDEIDISIDIPATVSLQSINYLLDGKLISTKQDAKPIKLPTKDLKLGYRLITAIVAHDDQIDTITTNIVLTSDIKPEDIAYKVIKIFPHDTSAYTQGLSYVDGKLLESTGQLDKSLLKWVDLNSGKTLQQTKLDAQYFGEGSLKIGNKIIMLTWLQNIGLVFDANTLKQLGTFPYEKSKEGWGLAFDGKQILRTDGSNRIWMMNKETYKEEGYIEVYDDAGEVKSLNEIEYINGKIYANVYLTNKIVVINPTSGKVEATIDLSALVPKNFFKVEEEGNNVLNGIAWDAAGKRLFVTGKKWPKLYQIDLRSY